jgi:pto-interacting protein 1
MIVMEFVCNGNLHNILHCSNANVPVPFPLENRLDIAIESAEVLSCMHSMYSPVLHGDIKPANILLDENFRPKISDFGIARLLAAEENQYTRSVIGCIGYVDPLFCQSGILTPKSDVYSFGVVLLEIITRKKAVDGNIILAQSFVEALRKGKKVRQMFDEDIANDRKNMKLLDDIAKLAAECLKMEEKMRPEMVEVADRLRTVRKAFHQRKVRNSTGNSDLCCSPIRMEIIIVHPPSVNVKYITLVVMKIIIVPLFVAELRMSYSALEPSDRTWLTLVQDQSTKYIDDSWIKIYNEAWTIYT